MVALFAESAAITVSIKPASSKTQTTRKLGLIFDGDSPRPGQLETLSTSYPSKVHGLGKFCPTLNVV